MIARSPFMTNPEQQLGPFLMVFQGGENEGYANIAAAASFVQHGARGIGIDLVSPSVRESI